MARPLIIQGGMGVAVSGWLLARAVSSQGQLGVVSGTALAVVLARRLQLGDPGGELRYALARFPFPAMAARVLADYFVPGGKAPRAPFKLTPMPTLRPRRALVELTVVANFVEVLLAKEGHQASVGINYLEKIQLPTLPSIYGAMLAGVDYILRTISKLRDRRMGKDKWWELSVASIHEASRTCIPSSGERWQDRVKPNLRAEPCRLSGHVRQGF